MQGYLVVVLGFPELVIMLGTWEGRLTNAYLARVEVGQDGFATLDFGNHTVNRYKPVTTGSA